MKISRPFIGGVTLFLFLLLGQQLAGADPGGQGKAEERCLALTLYWEGKGYGRDGMMAIAMVVLNRVESADFPDGICEVVRQGGEKPGCEFSYWCDGESDDPKNGDSWKLAREVANEVLEDPPKKDPTRGALYFHSAKIAEPWAVARKRTARIGGHVFYR